MITTLILTGISVALIAQLVTILTVVRINGGTIRARKRPRRRATHINDTGLLRKIGFNI